jgi:hypothetical protein
MKNMIKYFASVALIFAVVCCFNSASACGKYAAFIYKITNVEDQEYWGTGVYDNSNIYFTQMFVRNGEKFKTGDVVVAYFDPNNIVDGLIEVERAIPVGWGMK